MQATPTGSAGWRRRSLAVSPWRGCRCTTTTVLVCRLLDQGILHDLQVSRDSVRTGQFCDYLYARIGRWRTRKAPDLWPWRG